MMNIDEAKAYIHEGFEKYVPASGNSDCLFGEIVRAFNRIEYRNWNDGDHIGVGYGNETCNSAARFLMNYAEGTEATILKMWGEWNDNIYDQLMDELKLIVAEFLKENEDELIAKNEEKYDCLAFSEKEDYEYDDEDEDEEWDEDEDGWDDDEY